MRGTLAEMLAMASTVKAVPSGTPAERAAQLIASGTPKVSRSDVGKSDSEDDDGEDAYGIVSTQKLKSNDKVAAATSV
jgi:hypothetical protein